MIPYSTVFRCRHKPQTDTKDTRMYVRGLCNVENVKFTLTNAETINEERVSIELSKRGYEVQSKFYIQEDLYLICK